MPSRRSLAVILVGLLGFGGCTARVPNPPVATSAAPRSPVAATTPAKVDSDKGKAQARRAADVPAKMATVQKMLDTGNLGGAERLLEEVIAADPSNARALYLLAEVIQGQASTLPRPLNASLLVKSGDAARRRLAIPVELTPAEKQNLAGIFYNEACAYALNGDPNRAVASLSQAAQAGWSRASWADSDSDLDSLRKLPAFRTVQLQIEKRAVAEAMAALKPFPFDFRLKDLDGKPKALADVKGKLTIVNFWGTWCLPCRKEVPHFNALLRKYKDQGLRIVGLNYESRPGADSVKLVREFVKEHGIDYPCLIGDLATRDAVPSFEGFPTTLFLDEAGRVRLRLTGYQSLDALDIAVNAVFEAAKAEAEAKAKK